MGHLTRARFARFVRWLGVVSMACARVALASPPQLTLPLACVPGESCWVVRHMDHDPGAGVRDYRCGINTYDGHRGGDFAIRDAVVMQEGVTVVAAAAGKLTRIRDGVADRRDGKGADPRQACGNGVVVEHDQGWRTQYCHLRRGSIGVRVGERVERGQALGLVGSSGQADFPHLHLGVLHGATEVDPFGGPGAAARCGDDAGSLWALSTRAQLPYRRPSVTNFGVASEKPSAEAIRAGQYRSRILSSTAPVLIVWAEGFVVAPGDRVRLRVNGPGAEGATLVDHVASYQRNHARIYLHAGKKRGADAWAVGEYRAEIEVMPAEATRDVPVTYAFRFEVR